MNKYTERIQNGVVMENPALIIMLAICPAFAVTTSAIGGLGMGVSTLAVLILSNLVISLAKSTVPDQVRLPVNIVIMGALATVWQLLIQGYIPFLYDILGTYIPLVVVGCIILGRAGTYASKNSPAQSALDALGMGVSFTLGLTLVGLIRELLGSGTAFGFQIMPGFYEPIGMIVKAPGAFLILAIIVAFMKSAGVKTMADDKTGGSSSPDKKGGVNK